MSARYAWLGRARIGQYALAYAQSDVDLEGGCGGVK
jgi:hypothetical protein